VIRHSAEWQKNLEMIDFSVRLIGVMTIADEIDSQFSQAMDSYIAESAEDAVPAKVKPTDFEGSHFCYLSE
jgi:hypothetical protein